MTSISTVDPSQTISGGTYSISTSDELVQFLEMVEQSKIKGGEFVLANDIDMSSKSWSTSVAVTSNITFDGNGYKILNLKQPLWYFCMNVEIKNLGLLDLKLLSGDNLAGLASVSWLSTISNCYAQGNITSSATAGGLIATGAGVTLDSCWSDVDIKAETEAGGIVAFIQGDSNVSNCFSIGNIKCLEFAGGIAGIAGGTIENCYTSSKVSSAMGSAYEYVIACNDNQATGGGGSTTDSLTITNVTYDANVNPGMALYDNSPRITASNVTAASRVIPDITLQVGINSSSASQITFSTAFSISGLSSDIEEPNMLATLDEIIESVSNKQTELGSVQNRLESVLDEISIQYDNLVSSRSTIRDADIAEESSAYIRSQILQQAAATLLASANQTPSIALQLL